MINGLKIILIPGNGGATMDDHWFPSVIDAFGKEGVEVIAKNFPDPFLARRKYWIPFIENVLKADEHSVLIGHSSGAEAAMRYAENHRILGSVLVSPCHSDMGIKEEAMSGWYDGDWKWREIKQNQNFIIQFSSRDDYIVPIVEQDFVREQLHPEYHEFNERGHFNGQREFPELVSAVLENLKAVTINE